MKWLKTFLLILAMLVAGLIAAVSQNQQEVILTFAIWQTPQPLSVFWYLLIAFVTGCVFGIVGGIWAGLKRRLELRKLRQTLARTNAELERLRDITLQG